MTTTTSSVATLDPLVVTLDPSSSGDGGEQSK